mmetsp:Transcript_38645/g.106442  ORF Transcript_38645/g.106442 Transcript_38645/m.106442 type:complete len:740 (+) Transcript_38645:110-2329(+)
MEADYARYFLSNYQGADLPLPVLAQDDNDCSAVAEVEHHSVAASPRHAASSMCSQRPPADASAANSATEGRSCGSTNTGGTADASPAADEAVPPRIAQAVLSAAHPVSTPSTLPPPSPTPVQPARVPSDAGVTLEGTTAASEVQAALEKLPIDAALGAHASCAGLDGDADSGRHDDAGTTEGRLLLPPTAAPEAQLDSPGVGARDNTSGALERYTGLGTNTSSSSGVYRLAPPPPPTPMCSVGAVSPENEVVVIETLREEIAVDPKASNSSQEDLAIGHHVVLQEDDCEALLPDKGNGEGVKVASRRKHIVDDIDGADSNASESEGDAAANAFEARGKAAATPTMLPPPVPPPELHSPVSPPSMVSPQSATLRQATCRSCGNTGVDFLGKPCMCALGQKAAAAEPTAISGLSPRGGGLLLVPHEAENIPKLEVGRCISDNLERNEWQPPGAGSNPWPEIDSQLSTMLDRFFQDEKLWKQVAEEVATAKIQSNTDMLRTPRAGKARFRVQVPKNYPGVQYRRSKRLDDRHDRYAKHGLVLSGFVEDDGEWLRVGDSAFLPMRVGPVRILEPLPAVDDARDSSNKLQSDNQRGDISARWWNCGPGSGPGDRPADGADVEVVVTDGNQAMTQDHGVRGQGQQLQQHIPQHLQLPLETRDVVAAIHPSADPSSQEASRPRHAPELREAALQALQSDQARTSTLSTLNDRFYSDTINPFSDTPRGVSPTDSPLRSRPASATVSV